MMNPNTIFGPPSSFNNFQRTFRANSERRPNPVVTNRATRTRRTVMSTRPLPTNNSQAFDPPLNQADTSNHEAYKQANTRESSPLSPTNISTVTISTYDKLLTLYYKNPVDIQEIVALDLFRTRSALPNTVFEEADLFSPFETLYSLSDYKDNVDDEEIALKNEVKRLFMQHFQEDDTFSPLISFHLLLYKRIKIIEKVQEFQSLKTYDIKVCFI